MKKIKTGLHTYIYSSRIKEEIEKKKQELNSKGYIVVLFIDNEYGFEFTPFKKYQ